jgi:hypothetical protein
MKREISFHSNIINKRTRSHCNLSGYDIAMKFRWMLPTFRGSITSEGLVPMYQTTIFHDREDCNMNVQRPENI